MIADNLIYIAMLVFLVMVIGIVLTVLEFRYGEPKRQQERAENDPSSAGGGRPAR
jgi:hypothetical protein